jgi:two-component system sensor histidine kinase MtrB
VCRQIRAESGVPIVMLTARSDTLDVVVGLESGADDYVVKPFKPKELVARLRARLRTRDDEAPETLTIGPPDDLVTIDVPGHRVVHGGEQVQLTPLEFDLLVALARKPNTVFTREVLLEQVWNYRHAADTRLVNVHVQRPAGQGRARPRAPAGRRHRAGGRLQGGPGLTTGLPPSPATRTSGGPPADPAGGPVRSRPAAVSIDPRWRRALHGAERGVSEVAGSAGQRWRSSLQTRVVLTTLVVSSLVVALFISLLLESVGRGLVDAKTRTALGEARSGVVSLEGDPRLLSEELTDGEAVNQLEDVFADLVDRAAGSDYEVLLAGVPGTGGAFSSGGLGGDDVPEELTDRLDAREAPAYVFAPVPAGASERSLVVASPVRLPTQVGEYRLFHVFPLTAERETLSLVRRTATVSGVLLVGLLALITGLVARQVVAPVRAAARTAARLASGRLDERLTVRGEDEIAQLGSSFNSMADALQSQIRLLEDLSRVQRRFVSDVSHELRTPLTTVRMAADVLFDAREDFPRGASRSAELLQAELDRFEALLADLLEISRYDAGAADLDVGATDLCPVVRRVLAAAAPLADRHGSRFDLHLPARPVVAEVEQVRIERVLRNLVVNAVEHGEGSRSRWPCRRTTTRWS